MQMCTILRRYYRSIDDVIVLRLGDEERIWRDTCIEVDGSARGIKTGRSNDPSFQFVRTH